MQKPEPQGTQGCILYTLSGARPSLGFAGSIGSERLAYTRVRSVKNFLNESLLALCNVGVQNDANMEDNILNSSGGQGAPRVE